MVLSLHCAGSLVNLAKYPASTVQILGAEKALFRFAVHPLCSRQQYIDV